MRIYNGNTSYCPSYEESETTRTPGSKPGRKRKKAGKKARKKAGSKAIKQAGKGR